MQKKLLRLYFRLTIPFVILITILAIVEQIGIRIILPLDARLITIVLLLIAVLLSFILPLWFRLKLLNRYRERSKSLTKEKFLKFEIQYMILPLFTPYLMIVAYLLGTPKIPMSVIIIIAIYSIYFYFPSKKRIKLEKKIFLL